MKPFILRFTALFSAASLLFAFAVFSLTKEVKNVSSGLISSIVAENDRLVKNNVQFFTVILDAGHGGEDGGASGENGLLEKDLNLQTVFVVKDLLERCGVKVLLTRSEDVMLGEGTTGHKKLEDLRARLDFANAHGDALLLSIHMNKFPQSYCRGAQIYFSPNHPDSSLFAECMHTHVKDLQSDNKREIKSATSAIYLLDRVKIPAVLLECGFLSNREDAALLQSRDYQKKLAALILSSLSDYGKRTRQDKQT